MKTGPLVIGHRGALGHVAENTIESVEKAIELGVDGIEIDVFRCRSGQIVLMHDDTIDRTTNGQGYIEDLSISQVEQLIVEGRYKVPLLQDVLNTLNDQYVLNIELKGRNTADEVSHIVNYYIEEKGWSAENFLVSSFTWDELRSFRRKNKDIAIGILTEEDPMDALEVAKELSAVSIHPDHQDLTEENIAAIQQEGFKVCTWTVNEPEDIQKVKDLGVDAIITDFPERVYAD